MTLNRGTDATGTDSANATPLHRALDQSEKVKEKVVAAALELSDVNAVLKDDVAKGVPLMKVRHALDKSEAVEEKVQEAAEELAVLFLDLDGFKQINDTHGHDVGDRVLQDVANRLRDSIRGSDSVGRRGGDEFLVLMLEVQDDASATTFANKLCQHIAEPIVVDGVRVTVGTSIGIAVFPEDAESASELLKCADTAMYVAKNGRLGVSRFLRPESSRAKV